MHASDLLFLVLIILTLAIYALIRRNRATGGSNTSLAGRGSTADPSDALLEPIAATGVVLATGEHVYYESQAILSEIQHDRVYQGASAGASFRVASGISLRTGSSGGRSHNVDVTREVGSGKLYLTNTRLLFIGSSTTKEVPLKSAASFEYFTNGISCNRSNATPLFFKTNDANAGVILQRLLSHDYRSHQQAPLSEVIDTQGVSFAGTPTSSDATPDADRAAGISPNATPKPAIVVQKTAGHSHSNNSEAEQEMERLHSTIEGLTPEAGFLKVTADFHKHQPLNSNQNMIQAISRSVDGAKRQWLSVQLNTAVWTALNPEMQMKVAVVLSVAWASSNWPDIKNAYIEMRDSAGTLLAASGDDNLQMNLQ